LNLTIITVSKFFSVDLINTIESVNIQNVIPHEHIVIVSIISKSEIDFLLNNYSINYRIYIFNKDNSIYNAMNLGVRNATGNYLYFLNSGDVLFDNSILKQIKTHYSFFPIQILIFQTLQVYKNLSFLRNPKKILHKLSISPAHQGFIVPFYPNKIELFLFNEFNYISADSEWMKKLLLYFRHSIIELIICKFYLGGISNYPTLKTIKLKNNTNKYYLEISKYIFRLLFGTKLYYITISFLNGYTRTYR